MKKILITGGAGFIGGYIVNLLYSSGQHNVTVLDCFSKQIHGENYTESYLFKKIENKCNIVVGDVTDKDLVGKLIKDTDVIIHLAAETGTGQSMYEISKYTDVNIKGTSNLIEALMQHENNVKKLILSSSRSIYGEGMYFCEKDGVVYPTPRQVSSMTNGDFNVKCPHCNENVSSIPTNEKSKSNPISYYAFTKLAQEQILQTMCPSLNIPYTIYRYQNVYGAGQSLKNPYTGILSIFSNLFLSNHDINIFEDGTESRDFIHVKDVACITINAIENELTNNQIINVGSGVATSVLQVAETLKHYYNSDSKLNISGDFRKGDIRHNIADLTLAIELCQFEPSYTFKEGVLEFVEWVKQENDVNYQDLYYKSIVELQDKGMFIKKTD